MLSLGVDQAADLHGERLLRIEVQLDEDVSRTAIGIAVLFVFKLFDNYCMSKGMPVM